MTYNPEKHHRRSIRLPGYDYSQPGYYFITLCVENRENLFGQVKDEQITLNETGKLIDHCWRMLPSHFSHIRLDVFQTMPNHLHGIVNIVGAKHSFYVIQNIKEPAGNASPLRPNGTNPGSLGAIIQNFKSVTTRKINQIRKSSGIRLWQRNYYEHIIRNQDDYYRIRQYILENPSKWDRDCFHC
jgi:putative transposase